MEYLQYLENFMNTMVLNRSFKPYYKWNTFNTLADNLMKELSPLGFKPYYKWNTFNTRVVVILHNYEEVLNLIINGIPSIRRKQKEKQKKSYKVLNLIINGIPSIHSERKTVEIEIDNRFKPYYKWNTFNTALSTALAVLKLSF